MMNLLELESKRKAKSVLLSYLIALLVIIQYFDPVNSIAIPGNPLDKDRPWRVWSGNPCQPCDIRIPVGDKSFRIGFCQSPCVRNRTIEPGCVRKGDYDFECNCKPDYGGKFCEQPLGRKIQMENAVSSELADIKTQVIPIGAERSSTTIQERGSDYLFECIYPNGTKVNYEYSYIGEYFPDRLKKGQFKCEEKEFQTSSSQRCKNKIDGTTNICPFCRAATNASLSDGLDHYSFSNFVWDIYSGSQCEKVVEIYIIDSKSTKPEKILRDNVNCDLRKNGEEMYRGGCRATPDASSDSCIQNSHMGHRCKTCDKGVWGNKCQFVIEDEWDGCPDPEFKEHPCGDGGTLVQRPNGKFCICPPGKIDGFYNVFKDRVKDPSCSPAKTDTDDWVTEKNSELYKFFVGMSQFHTYHGCRIDDPCHNFSCTNNGKQEIVDLIDEDSYGFKKIDMVRSPLSALEINNEKFKCVCNSPDYEGDARLNRNPCFLDKRYCKNNGVCLIVSGTEKRCKCFPPFSGPQCEIVNPCKIQELCDGSVTKCFPCKHGGSCETTATTVLQELSTSGKYYKFSCDCKKVLYVGKFCEFSKGEMEFQIVTADSLNILVGIDETYEILVRKKGDVPRIIVDMGDGFLFTIIDDILEPLYVPDTLVADIPKDETYFYKFKHKYTKEREYEIRAFLTNGDPNPNENADQIIDSIFLSGRIVETITASLPVELKCLPNVRLINVGRTVDESTPYTRKSEFIVESALEPRCDNNLFDFDYSWTLHKLDSSPFPSPSPENNWHIEKIVSNASQKYVTFKPRSLLNGRYLIEYIMFVEINGIRASNSAKGYFNMELNPPKIVIHGGSYRTVNVLKEVILDASDSLDESFPEISQLLSFLWVCESPSACELGGPWRGPQLKILPGRLMTGVDYRFHLDISIKHDNIYRSTTTFLNLLGSFQSLQINCIENCERMNPGDEILVHCSCFDCLTPSEVIFSWEPSSDAIVVIQKQDKSSIGIILPNPHTDDILKTVICKTVNKDLVAKLDLRINTPPSGGNCGIEPHEGVYLKTVFNIECEGFTDEDVPLRYSFYAGEDPDDLDNLYLLAYDINPRATNIYLPYHPKGGKVTVLVKVTDNRELSTLTKINVIVTLPDSAEYPELLKSLVSSKESLMQKRQSFGDDQGALQLQLVVLHGILNNQFIGLPQQDMIDIVQYILSVLSKTPMHSFKAVEQALGSLHLLKKVEENTKLETLLLDSSIVLFNSASQLAEFVISNNQITPKETMMSLVRRGVDSARRILKRSYTKGQEIINSRPHQPINDRYLTDFDSFDEVKRDYFFEVHELQDSYEAEGNQEVQEGLDNMIQEYAKISHHTFAAIEHLLDAVGERLNDGQTFIWKTDDLTVYIAYNRKINSFGTFLELETSSGKPTKLKMSAELKSILESQGISNIITEVIEILDNPFFDDTSAIPGTPVVSVVVKDRSHGGARLPIHLDGFKQPLEFYFPLTTNDKDVLEKSKTERYVVLKPLDQISNSDLQPFHLILPFNSRVEVIIEDFSIDMEFFVVVSKDFWPTKQDFCDVGKRKVLNVENGYSFNFQTEDIGLDEEPEEHFLEYFVSIYPYQPRVWNEVRKYSIYFTRPTCLFRDENSKFWSETGCRIGDDTNTTSLHCICNHASILAGTQFVVPSDIPTISVFDINPEKFENNVVVLITVCMVIFGYFIGMLTCRMYDLRDQSKHVGITIMSDTVGDSRNSYYLVTILTGSRFQSGTTANVSIQIYGSKGRSQVYVLKEKPAPVLNRGGHDTFLVMSQKDLGVLEKIRVWHDNFGSSPNWFCRKIIIRDVKSDDEWLFFIDNWLQVSGEESTIIFEQNAAIEKDLKTFRSQFQDNLIDLVDYSLWVSLFWCRSGSRFTKCQRLSRAMAILTFYMFLNMLIWFNSDDADDTCDFQIYIYSFVIALLDLPLGIILLFLFRNIRRRYIPTLIVLGNIEQQNDSEIENLINVPVNPKPHPLQRKTKSVSENDQSSIIGGAGDNANDDFSDISSNFSIPSTNINDLECWLDDQPDTFESMDVRLLSEENEMSIEDRIALGRIGYVHAIRSVDPDSFVYPGDHGILELEYLIDDEIMDHLIQSDMTLQFDKVGIENVSIPQAQLIDKEEDSAEVLNHDLVQVEEDESEDEKMKYEKQSDEKKYLNFEFCEMSPANKTGCFFPWWFIFITWLLCLVTIFICLYFTMIYGLEISYFKSISWLIGIASTVVFSLLLSQPLSALIWAFVLAFCMKKSTKRYQNRFQIFLQEKDNLGYRRPLKSRVFNPCGKYVPLSGNEIFRFRLKAKRQEKIKRVLLKLLFYSFILIPLIIIAYTGHSKDMFRVVQNLRDLLKLNQVQGLHGKLRSFQNVTNEVKLVNYLENVLIPALHPVELYNGVRLRPNRFDPSYIDDGQSILVGVPRIRQVRVRPGACNVPSSVEKTFKECFSPYSSSTRDTADYNPLWRPVVNGKRSRPSKTNDVWKFQEFEPDFLMSLPQRGKMGIYDGGGYVVELGRRKRESLSVLRYLDRSRWFDHRTRGVFIELTVWNPNVDIYADIILVFENGAAELAHTYHHITPLYLSATDCFKPSPWLSLSYGIIFIAFFVLIAIFCWNIFSSSEPRVYGNLWFWMDFLVICCILVSMLIAVKKQFVVAETLEQVEGLKINQFVSLQRVAYWNEVQSAAFSITQCICFMKIWRIFILLDERFYLAYLTVRLAADMIVAYVFVIVIFLVAFAFAGHFIFGNELAQFDTFRDSLISLADESLSVDFFLELQTNHRILGPVFSLIFGFIVTCVSLNLLLYIMNLSLHNAKRISQEKIREYYWGAIVRFITRSRKRSKDPAIFATILPPHRLQEIKKIMTEYFHKCVYSREGKSLGAIKKFTNESILKGSGYHVSIRKSRRYNEELRKEMQLVKMRTATAQFLMSKIGVEMSSEEFKKFANVNQKVVSIRLQRLEAKIREIDRKVRTLG